MLPFRSSDAQQRIELEHGWEFLPDATAKLQIGDLATAQGWRPVRVGLSWNVQFEDLREYMGAAWYRVGFDLALSRHTRHVIIKFGAVDYFCELFVNGIRIGSHEGGYTPFSFDISNALRDGANELEMRVIDPPMDEKENRALFPEMLYNEIPHGKQNWYVQNSGIWQGVRLEFAPSLYIDRAQITPKIDGSFNVEVFLEGEDVRLFPDRLAQSRLRATIFDTAGTPVWNGGSSIESEFAYIEGQIDLPRPWGPSSPTLYTLELEIEGAVSYQRRIRFGFRELAAREGKLYLNGQPFYMIAALDQDFYPETIHTPSSEEFVRDMMMKAKRLGINVLRCHLKVAHPVYLDVADELGMVVWAELPSWSDCWFPCDHFSPKAAQRGELMFAEVVRRDWNHPCLLIQTIMNESWGIDLKDPVQRQWLKDTFDRIKSELAPLGRLVIDNSACEGNFHLKSDIEDFHNYYSQPDQSDLWDRFINDFASHAAWTYSPYGDAERSGSEPLVVSEFGNWGLPLLPQKLPWWFHHAFGEREVTRPAGVLERFKSYKLDRIFTGYNDLAEETQWHQFRSLKYEIESMRRRSSIQGYCVTGMTDVHWEVNGLLDMWRQEKVFGDQLAAIQQPHAIMAEFPTFNFYAGQAVELPVLFSHYGPRPIEDARVRWTTDSGASGTILLSRALPGSVTQVGTVRFPCSGDAVSQIDVLHIEVRTRNGNRLCENSYEFYVYAPVLPEVRVALHDPIQQLAGLREGLAAAGYSVVGVDAAVESGAVVVSSVFDAKVQSLAASGAAMLLLADSDDFFPKDHKFKCTKRAATWLDGRWFSNYNWINPHAPEYERLALHRILAFEARAVAPDHVIENVPPEKFAEVSSGITLAWLNLNNALTMSIEIGDTRALLTTFRFGAAGADPYAARLFASYVRRAQAFATPQLQTQATQQPV